MYKVIGSPQSRLTRVSWMLQELGQEYEIVKAKPHSDTLRQYNPAGKGPVLADGKTIIIDSAAICAYLADMHPEQNMGAKSGTAERGMLDSWLHFAQNDLEAPLWLKAKHKFILPEELRLDVSKITAIEFSNSVKALEKRLGENKFAMGSRFTCADVLLGHCGSWARNGKFEIASDSVNAYFDRVLARDALARARALEAEMV